MMRIDHWEVNPRTPKKQVFDKMIFEFKVDVKNVQPISPPTPKPKSRMDISYSQLIILANVLLINNINYASNTLCIFT